MNATAIANHLNIASEAIIKIEEWANVLWVKFVGGCRFVSKKVIKMQNVDTAKASPNVQAKIKAAEKWRQKGKASLFDSVLKTLQSWSQQTLEEYSQLSHIKSVQDQYKIDQQIIKNYLQSVGA